MLTRSAFAVACVAAALTGARVSADCADPEAFGVPYAVETSDAALAPHLEDDELVLRVSGRGLPPADACEVPAADQFTLHWVKEADMAIVKLKREAPESCLGEEETGETPTATELRLPLPFELRRGAEDFSRMVLGMPPGGLYEAYKIFDHSVLTRSADAYLLDEDADEDADALFGDDDDDADDDDDDDAPPDGDTASGADANEGDESLGDGAAMTATNVPRKAAAEKVATE
jgi:hypothetical protein